MPLLKLAEPEQAREINLYDYQRTAKTAVKNLFISGQRRAMLMSPTGSGKTIIFVSIIQDALAKGSKILIVVDAISLIEQTSRVLDDYGIEHGIIQADNPRRSYLARVQLASAQTLARRDTDKYDLIIVDEAHVSYLSTRRLIDTHKGYAIGFSATPFHAKGKEDWHNLIVVARMGELIEKGFLSPYIVYAPKPPDLSRITTQNGDFNQKELGEEVDKPKIIGDVVTTWLKYGEDRLTMCFGVNIAHSKHLCSEFNRYNVKALHIDSWDDDAIVADAIHKFKTQQIKVLCSVAKLIKGFDVPEVGCISDAAPTKSLSRHIQKWGRGLRTADGKTNCIILDHGGNLERNGYCEDIYIDDLLEEPEHRSKAVKRDKPLPKPCISCGFDSDGQYPCPLCDYLPEKPSQVEHEAGELGRVEKITAADKLQWYAMLLHYSRSKGYADGWASHAFFGKFSAWPHRKTGVVPMEPNKEVFGYIQHLNIKKAKAKQLPTACRYCGSKNLFRVPGVGPHKEQLRCGGCDHHIQWIGK